jgi:hypothetical protein
MLTTERSHHTRHTCTSGKYQAVQHPGVATDHNLTSSIWDRRFQGLHSRAASENHPDIFEALPSGKILGPFLAHKKAPDRCN